MEFTNKPYLIKKNLNKNSFLNKIKKSNKKRKKIIEYF